MAGNFNRQAMMGAIGGGNKRSDVNPTAEDIFEAARYLGIDPIAEPQFLWVAEEMLTAPLPDGWPAVKPNEKGVQKFVYAGMVDYMRRVSATVTIGRAFKGGEKDLGHTFLLCRH